MIRKIYLFLLTVSLMSTISFSANQANMYIRGAWADKTAMTLIALPDNTNNWGISIPASTLGTGSKWFKFDASGSWANTQNWGYNTTPTFNTSTNLLLSSGNGFITATSGKTYFFSIKDVANSTATTVGFVFELGGTPVTISSASASSATPGTAVTVTATLSGSLVTNQTVWLRYAVGSSTYATSTITQMTGSGSTYTASIPGQIVGTTVYYYCFTSGTVTGGGGVTTSNVTQATINKSTATNYTVATAQVLAVTPSTLSGFSYFPGSGPSASQSYALSGQYLTGFPGNITITAPTDYEISKDNASFVSSDTIGFSSATLASRTIYVRLKSGLSSGNFNSENITNAGGGASTVNVSCSGSVLKYAPTNQATAFSASNGSPSSTVIHFVWTDASSSDGYLIRGSSIGYSSITDPVNGTPVSDGGADKNIAQGVQLADITGLTQGTTYYFKIYAYTNSGANIQYNLVSPTQSSATTTVTTFYSKLSGNLELLSSWGANADGSGSAPVDFTSSGMTFVIANNPTPTLGGTWTVSGTGSKIQVGDGTNAVNFTAASTITGINVDIKNNATVTLGSNVTFTGTINVLNGGILNCNGYIVSGTAGIFNLNAGGTLKIGSSTGITSGSTASGNIQTTGTRTFNTAAKYVYNGTVAQVTGNGLPTPLASGGLLQNSNTSATVTLSQYMQFSSGSAVLVDAGATFSTGANGPTYNAGCTVTINGTYQIEQGGGSYTSGSIAFTYGSNGTFAVNYTSAKLGLYNNNPCWNNNTGYVATPPNVNIKGAGGISIQTGVSMVISGTFQTAGPVEMLYSSSLLVNGTCQMNSGGSFTTTPSYGASSTLKYNSGTSYTRGNEWTAVTSGAGYPNNVQLSNNTTLGMSTTVAQCAGSITIDAGSTLNTTINTLTAIGNISINGTISLGGDVKTNGDWTVAAAGVQTNNSKAVWFTGATGNQTITKLGGGVVYFDYVLVNKAAGNVVVSNSPATDIVLNTTTGSVLQLTNAGQLDLNGRSLTFNNAGGSILINGTGRTITSAVPGAMVNITGSKSVSGTSPNTLIFDNNVTLALSASFDFGASLTTINGTLLLNGGYSVTNSPAYGPSSLLKYYCGGVPPRGSEWVASSGYGYPNDVQIGYATTLDPAGTSLSGTACNLARDLIIDENSAIYMDYTGHNMTVPLVVGRNFSLSGSLSLSGVVGGDIQVGGNWTRAGNFYPNARAVICNGSAQQVISGVTTFDYLIINNSTGVALHNDAVVNAQLTLTSGSLAIGANTLTFNSPISGSGLLTSDTTSSINIIGSAGSIGIPSSISVLNNLTLNNAAGSSLLGNLSVNGTLNLTSGELSLNGNTITLKNPISFGAGSLASSSSSGIVISGSVSGIAIPSTVSNLGELTLNNSNGTSLEGDITIHSGLTLASGQLNQNTHSLSIASGASVYYNGGSITPALASPALMTNFTPPAGGTISNTAVSGTVALSNGSLTVTPGQILALGASGNVSGESAGNYIVGAVSTTPTINASAPNIAGLGISINPNGNNLGTTTIIRTSGANAAVTVNGKTSISRRWKITPATQPSSEVSVSLAWVSDDDNDKTLASLYVWKSEDDGATWSNIAGPIDGSSRSVTFTTSSFSDFTLGDINSPLPVELTSFTAMQKEKQVVLNWKTATEINSSSFEVEKKKTGTDIWQKQGDVKSAGNSNSPKNYSFADKQLKVGKFDYRLKMIDNDGTFKYSAVINLEISAPKSFELSQNYPNPFNPSTTINYQLPATGKVTIGLYSIIGQLVMTLVDETKEAGYYTVNVNGSGLSSGTYIYKLESGSYSVTKKMVLLK